MRENKVRVKLLHFNGKKIEIFASLISISITEFITPVMDIFVT